MKQLTVDFLSSKGSIKPMHAVNNGPVYKFSAGQDVSNLEDYKAAGIPYARNHDASFFWVYGGNHTVDVDFIFPDYDADPYAPESYDFTCTDELMRVMALSGTKVFYRLGSRIEHEIKKYNTLPPKDFHKWAVICEHIIRHYTEGWANGFTYDVPYWEIWNEPDLALEDGDNRLTWGGTPEEFFELYNIAANHLKTCFPQLKIGGPAVSHRIDWVEEFLKQLKAPLDFFSWHYYGATVEPAIERAKIYRQLLDKYGHTDTESILNEWNYIRGFAGADYLYSIRALASMKGAAFIQAMMSLAQDAPIDMLMYYDARPSAFNGMWASYTYDRLKGYYPFVAFNTLYRLGEQVQANAQGDALYITAAKGKGEAAILITRFEDADPTDCIEVALQTVGGEGYQKAEVYLLDEAHDLSLIECCDWSGEKAFTIGNHSVLLVKLR